MKKYAIIVVDSMCFSRDIILSKDNEQCMRWLYDVDCDVNVRDRDSIQVYDDASDFVMHFNDNARPSDDDFLVGIEYDADAGILNYVRDKYKTEDIISFKEEKPKTIYDKFIVMLEKHNDRLVLLGLGDFYETFDSHAEKVAEITGVSLTFGKYNGQNHHVCGFPKKALDTYLAKMIRSGYKVAIENTDGEEDLYPCVISKVDAPEPKQEETPKQEEPKKPNNDYGRREFIDHARYIFEQGHGIFHTEVGGNRYIINGLFDNQDLITCIYEEETIKLVDRRFEVGAEDSIDDECEYLADYFEKVIVKDQHWGDAWCMTEKQFNFLKNA